MSPITANNVKNTKVGRRQFIDFDDGTKVDCVRVALKDVTVVPLPFVGIGKVRYFVARSVFSSVNG